MAQYRAHVMRAASTFPVSVLGFFVATIGACSSRKEFRDIEASQGALPSGPSVSSQASMTAAGGSTFAGLSAAQRVPPAPDRLNTAEGGSSGTTTMGGTAIATDTGPRSATSTRAAYEQTGISLTERAVSAADLQNTAETTAEMLLVPGGTFTMGQDNGGEEDEHPAHRVTIASYFLDRLEITVEKYLLCVKAKACRMYREDAARTFRAGDDARYRAPMQPISGVSWDDANDYCHFVGKRLPTEAEWERAARGDDDRRYPWGNEAPDPKRHGCFGRATGPFGQTTCEVGSYREAPGPYGHLDLGGNVWEWTADDYDPYAYRRATAAQGVAGTCGQILATQNDLRAAGRQGFTGKNPIPDVCEKVLRGGAFNYPGNGLRVTNRVHHPRNFRILVAGFRCARNGT